MKRKIAFFVCLILAIGWMTVPVPVLAGNNIALGKRAFASSQLNDTYVPKNVTDGDVSTFWSVGGVPLTGRKGGYEYIAVDLGDRYDISAINARSRRDYDQPGARSGWTVEVSNDPEFKDVVEVGIKSEAGAFASDLMLEPKLKDSYRYVRVICTLYFIVAEIEVYGQKQDTQKKNDFKDVKEPRLRGIAGLLKFLGIMQEESAEEFGTEKLVTKAEAVEYVSRVANIPAADPESLFEDVKPDNPHCGYITAAYKTGIISGSKNFEPDRYIKSVEFMKMLVSVMGYAEKAGSRGGYPTGFITIGNELKLMSKLNLGYDDAINKRNSALMLYNALMQPVLEYNSISGSKNTDYIEGRSLLEYAFRMTLQSGIVTANAVTTLTGPDGVGKGCVEVDHKRLTEKAGSLQELLGQKVYYLTRINEGDQIILAWADDYENIIETVRSSDITKVSETKIEYTAQPKDGSYTLSNNIMVLKNGVAYSRWKYTDFIPQYGYDKLIDNDNDGIIDVMFIYEPVVIVVNCVSNDNGDVFISGENGTSISCSRPDSLKIEKNGKKLDVENIADYDLALVYMSENKKCLYINVVSNRATGTINEFSDEDVCLNGSTYALSDYYKESQQKTENLKVNSGATFVLNEYNEVVWVTKKSFGSDNDMLGVIVKAVVGQRLSSPEFKIFTKEAKFVTLKAADRMTLDGVQCTFQDVNEILQISKQHFVGKFVLYGANANGEIYRMDTENYYPNVEQSSKMVKINIDVTGTESTAACYIPKSNGIYNKFSMQLPMMASTTTFLVPLVDNAIAEDDSYNQYFKVQSAATAFGDQGRMTYSCAFYGADENGYPEFAVKYATYSKSQNGLAAVINREDAAGVLIDKVTQYTDKDGAICSKIIGYDILTGDQKFFIISSEISKCYDSYKIQIDKKPWTDGSKFIDTGLVDTNLSNQYISNVKEMQRGDIVRGQEDGKDIVGTTLLSLQGRFNEKAVKETTNLERVFAKGTDISYTTYDGSFYSAGGKYPDWPNVPFRLTYGTGAVNKGTLILNSSGSNKEIFQYAQVKNLFVCDSDGIKKCQPANLPAYINAGSKIVLYSSNGYITTVVVYN